MPSSDSTGNYDKALEYGVKLLSIVKRTKKQLCRRLLEKGFDEDIVRKVTKTLETRGIIDDREFALRFVQEKQAVHPLGRRRLEHELRSKGLEDKDIETVLSGIDETAEQEGALSLAQLKAGALGKIPLVRKRKKIYDFLIRRGFSFDLAREIIDKIL